MIEDEIKPVVGMGITVVWYSDRKAGTIIEVSKSGKSAKFQYDEANRLDTRGMDECQNYEYSRNPKGAIHSIFKARDGSGRWKVKNGGKQFGWALETNTLIIPSNFIGCIYPKTKLS
jgi:hypothetical protein